MMTHNCVAFTSLSKHAQKYKLTLVPEAITTISEVIHMLALAGLQDAGLPFASIEEAL